MVTTHSRKPLIDGLFKALFGESAKETANKAIDTLLPKWSEATRPQEPDDMAQDMVNCSGEIGDPIGR